MKTYFKIDKLENAKIDLSYLYRDFYNHTPSRIVVDVIDKDSIRNNNLIYHFTIVSDDGYVFNDRKSVGFFEIELNDVLHKISYDDFIFSEKMIVEENMFNFELDNFYLQNVDLSKTEYIEVDNYLICLMGGFNKYKNVIMLYEEVPEYRKHEIVFNDKTYSYTTLSIDTYDSLGGIVAIDDIIKSISIVAVLEGEKPNPPTTDELFHTYLTNNKELEEIKNYNKITKEMIINCYLCPLEFKESDLIELPIKVDGTQTPIMSHKFLNDKTRVKICEFEIPTDLYDIKNIVLKIPYISEITLNNLEKYDKIISVEVEYENSSNSTNLYIYNNDVLMMATSTSLLTSVPFKPSTEYANYNNVSNRKGYFKSYIELISKRKIESTNFIKCEMKPPLNILKDEFEILKNYLQNGVKLK